MRKEFYEDMTRLYSIQKTLRWELKPIGKTREYLQEKRLIESDEHMAESYKIIKKMIDRYHKKVIAESLENGELTEELLEEYYQILQNEKDEKQQEKIELLLRKEAAAILTSHPDYKNLFGKEMVLNELPKIAENEKEYKVIEEFSGFTTLLKNYFDIRKNLYSVEKKKSTVPYRLIHENLPKFFGNVRVYEKLCNYNIDFSAVIQELEPDLGEIDMGRIFSVVGFNKTLSQKGIDRYNQIIGGISEENVKKKGLNEIINLWNQQHKKQERLPKFVPLYKQILSDRETSSFVIDAFETDKEVLEALKKSYDVLQQEVFERKDGVTFSELYHGLNQYKITGIFVKNGKAITELSNQVFGSWNVLKNGISSMYDITYTGKRKLGTEKFEEEKIKNLKKKKSYSLQELKEIAENYSEEKAELITNLAEKADRIVEKIKEKMLQLSYALEKDFILDKPLRQNTLLSNYIKEYLDSVKELQAFLQLLQGDKLEPERDERFYGDFWALWDSLVEFNSLYNKTRNYITKKLYSTEKIKLNFQTPTLLSGWDSNKESDNLGIILQRDDKYYLGIMDKGNRKVFKEIPECEGECYEKMEYKLLPGPQKMLPKVFFSSSRIGEFAPSSEILRIYHAGSFKKGPEFSREDCHKLIDFFKASIEKHEDWKKFEFHFSETKNYQDISEFYREIMEQGYKLTRKKVPAAYVEKLVENGQLYLFQIYSKDFSKYSKGKPDLQTIYWKMLFDERNLKNVVYKLNGEAEIFYRKPSVDIKTTARHEAGEKIENKNLLNPKKKSVFQYDLIKNKRYAEEKFLFHVPITLNFVSEQQNQINDIVNQKIKEAEDVHIIGIDRGERNLLYAVVVNQKGKIIAQVPLNIIANRYFDMGEERKQEVDYHGLLNKKEKERDKARKNWTTVEQIKDLKNGYLSQAVHTIVQLAIKYNALIVLEDLSSGFMRGRQKIEKQVYQNFEKMLIQKLNFLVTEKDRTLENVQQPGGALMAYQLTNKFESFQKLGKQSGILFYVPAWNTSKLDPTTGFVNLLYPHYETIEKAKSFISKFDKICFNSEKNYFEFSFDYNNFTAKAEGTRTKWTICTYGMRLENFRNAEKNNEYETRIYNPTEEFKKLLNEKKIEYTSGKCIKEELLKKSESGFLKAFIKILQMTLQMRNSSLGSEDTQEDYIQSCVMNKDGEFFNSNAGDKNWPQDADANGAYNIARKGLMLVEKIKENSGDTKGKMKITNKEWLQFAQKGC